MTVVDSDVPDLVHREDWTPRNVLHLEAVAAHIPVVLRTPNAALAAPLREIGKQNIQIERENVNATVIGDDGMITRLDITDRGIHIMARP